MYSSVLASPSRVQRAHEIGLAVKLEHNNHNADRHADYTTLAGMECKAITMADRYAKQQAC
jgi:hypothetical protein